MTSNVNQFEANQVAAQTLTLLAGETLSEALYVYGTTMVGLIIPDGLTNIDIKFSVSLDGVNFYDLVDETNSDIFILIGPTAKATSIDPPNLYPWRWIKLRFDFSEATDMNFIVSAGAI